MKKTISLVLALLFVLALFAGCGGNGGGGTPTQAPDNGGGQATQAPAATKAPSSSGNQGGSQATEAPATEAPVEDEAEYRPACCSQAILQGTLPTRMIRSFRRTAV